MIQTVWPYLAVMLLAAGIFPALERRTGWKFFSVFPPIVLVYLAITALAVVGLWQLTPEIQDAQSVLIRQGVPKEKIQSIGLAATVPIDPAPNEEAYLLNRRVEIWLEDVSPAQIKEVWSELKQVQ